MLPFPSNVTSVFRASPFHSVEGALEKSKFRRKSQEYFDKTVKWHQVLQVALGQIFQAHICYPTQSVHLWTLFPCASGLHTKFQIAQNLSIFMLLPKHELAKSHLPSHLQITGIFTPCGQPSHCTCRTPYLCMLSTPIHSWEPHTWFKGQLQPQLDSFGK